MWGRQASVGTWWMMALVWFKVLISLGQVAPRKAEWASPYTRIFTECWKLRLPQEPTHTGVPVSDSMPRTERILLPGRVCTLPKLVSRPRQCTRATPLSQDMLQVIRRDVPMATATSGSGGFTWRDWPEE